MKNSNGHFVISLDYELHWGLFDLKPVSAYKENLANVHLVIERLLELSDRYNIKLTFATVGFLFAKDKEELIRFSPKQKPKYIKEVLSPYRMFGDIGHDENDDPFHFGYSSLKKIKNNGNHEIGTHTFCHYYCNEAGQNIEEFKDDLNSVNTIANHFETDIKSIVFPRNMINDNYLEAAYHSGITSFRGTEKAYIYNIDPKSPKYNWLWFRLQRVLDCYINLTGYNTYDVYEINKSSNIVNLPSSRFLRPFSKTLQILEPLKLNRIKKGMRKAAKNNELYHLWWHPHNFGKDMDKNFEGLETIFKEYEKLNKKYGFNSETMTSLTNNIISATAS